MEQKGQFCLSREEKNNSPSCCDTNHFPQKTVIVLGPPRSGTSTVGGMLSLLGVDMGRVREANPDNPKGFFEDLDFLFLHNDIFEEVQAGCSGFRPPLPENIIKLKGRFDDRIKELVQRRNKNSSSSVWGWKVVGTTLTIELFLPYILHPHFVVVFRNILDIAKSCVDYTKRREKLRLDEALKLAIFYYRAIFDFFENHPDRPRLFVSYEDILEDSRRETKRLAEFLSLEFREEDLEKIREFIIPRHRLPRERKIARLKYGVKSFGRGKKKILRIVQEWKSK